VVALSPEERRRRRRIARAGGAVVLVFDAAVVIAGLVLGLSKDSIGTFVIVVAIGTGVLATALALTMFFAVGEAVVRYLRSRR